MKTCNKCGLPETYETLEFDEQGICNICHQHEYKNEKIDWTKRFKALENLVQKHRGKGSYDCIIPFSGGKDSTFTLYYMVEKMGLKPLVIQFDHGFMRPGLLENNVRTFRRLGVDVHSFTPNWRVVKRLMRESFIRKGDFCWHCHTGIFAYPVRMAVRLQIPFIIWGEPSSEYTAYFNYEDDTIEQVDERRFNRFVNLGITAEDMEGMIFGDDPLDSRDLEPYTYPTTKELRALGCESVCLGSFIPWDVKQQVGIITRELGWKGDDVEGMPRGLYPYEKIECYMQGVRDYIKYLKRGYARVTQMTALDIRNGRMSRAEALKLIEQHEGRKPPSLELFLDYIGMSEDQFHEVALSMVVEPHQPDVDSIACGDCTHDFNCWSREVGRA
jgi:N-acetyl sugar amidotransferase